MRHPAKLSSILGLTNMQGSQKLTDRKTKKPTNKSWEGVLFKETTFVSLQKLQTCYRKKLHQEFNMQI